MQPCAAPYLEALKKCNVDIADGEGPTWYSSVFEGEVVTKKRVNSQYWVDNMTQTVLFDVAVTAAAEEVGPFDLVLEIGPHPSLKSPVLEMLEKLGLRSPYSGTLSRGKNDIVEFSSALGFTWTQLGAGSVDFEMFEKEIFGAVHPKSLLADLPKYPFEHARSHRLLTRLSGGHANIHSPPHPLIGRRCYERETTQEIQWRNFLRLDVSISVSINKNSKPDHKSNQ